jgi:hypothetical protein
MTVERQYQIADTNKRQFSKVTKQSVTNIVYIHNCLAMKHSWSHWTCHVVSYYRFLNTDPFVYIKSCGILGARVWNFVGVFDSFIGSARSRDQSLFSSHHLVNASNWIWKNPFVHFVNASMLLTHITSQCTYIGRWILKYQKQCTSSHKLHLCSAWFPNTYVHPSGDSSLRSSVPNADKLTTMYTPN